MDSPLADYLLFLARTVTLVLAVVVAVAGAAAVLAGARRRALRRPRIEVTDLGRRYDQLRLAVRAGMLPRTAARREVRARRRALKAEDRERGTDGAARRPRVFVVDFVGTGDPRASAVTALREEVTAILSVAGQGDEVVVRLENPGGVVHDQGLAASQLRRVRQRGVRLTVAVDTIAASGGYMMACVADRIVAAPFALVGSIGVVAAIPNVHRLLDRYGVEVEQFTGGQFKRTVTPYGEPTEAERAKLTEQIEDIHALFKEFVGLNRPRLDLDRVATGEAWYGTRALDLGLVDDLSTSDDYLLAARDRADLYLVGWRGDRTSPRRLLSRVAAGLTALARSALS
jgi:serine protease SohB